LPIPLSIPCDGFLAFTKKAYDWVTARELLLASAKALNVNPELVRDFYDRFSMITHVKLLSIPCIGFLG